MQLERNDTTAAAGAAWNGRIMPQKDGKHADRQGGGAIDNARTKVPSADGSLGVNHSRERRLRQRAHSPCSCTSRRSIRNPRNGDRCLSSVTAT
jgi:hypothetical protein